MPDRPTDDHGRLAPAEPLDERSVAEAESETSTPTEEIVRHGGTFESFRHRGYALFWTGAFVSNTGSWMQAALVGYLAYGYRGSAADLGIVTFISQIPTLFLALPGGVLADRVDKAKIIIWAQVLLMLQALVFGTLYVTGNLSSSTPITSLAWIAGLGFVAGVLASLSFPAWVAILPELVPKPTLLNAIALNSAQFQSARMMGPLAYAAVIAIAGQAAGVADVFWINAVSFVFVIAAVWAARNSPHAPERHIVAHDESVWTSLTRGVRYAATHRVVGTVILSTLILTLVGMPYVFLMPAVAEQVLGFARGTDAHSHAYSLLLGANGFGAVIGALTVAGLPRAVRRERLMRIAIIATAVVLVAFAFAPWLWLSLALSALAGACLLTTNSLANTSVQSNAPHHLRGRVMSVFIMSFMGVMPLSAAAFGPLAEAIGTSWAIAAGAMVLLGWGLFLTARPAMLTPRASETE